MGNQSDNIKQQFYNVEDVIRILNVSRPKAYAIMKGLNAELSAKGFTTVAGKISIKYFNEKLYIQEAI